MKAVLIVCLKIFMVHIWMLFNNTHTCERKFPKYFIHTSFFPRKNSQERKQISYIDL